MSNILIPIINIDVYHMTTTGKDKETLKSFLSTGANPNSSTGNDQGRGLYVWTSKEAAIQRSLSEQNLKEGYPLLITLNVDLNPGEWFIDTEVHSKLAGELIFES